MSCSSPPPSSSSSSSVSALVIGKHEVVIVLLAIRLELAAGVVKAKAAKTTLTKEEERDSERLKEVRLHSLCSLSLYWDDRPGRWRRPLCQEMTWPQGEWKRSSRDLNLAG